MDKSLTPIAGFFSMIPQDTAKVNFALSDRRSTFTDDFDTCFNREILNFSIVIFEISRTSESPINAFRASREPQ